MTDFFKHLLHEFELPLKNPVLIFSVILLIILLSPILLRKLNIPGIIGLIIAGVAIGPHGLNILANTDAIKLFSTIGLLYIMFIAGLELDMNEFKTNRNKSLVFGFFTFIIPISIGFPVCYYFLDYGFNTSLLTASMFATHTLVAYPIVSKFGVTKNQAVAVTVGGTILTDTAVLIILAVIIGSSEGTLNSEFWIRLGISLTIFSAIMFFLIPRIAKWFFQKLESEKHSHYIFVLAVVFFAAFLAEVAGVEPIIGAFVAGLALNKLIPNSSALMNRIEFIGNSLFIPFFLISVGMIVNMKVIFNGTTALIVAGTLSVVALFGKWFAALITQLIFNYTGAQRQLIFGLSSAHAAATLAVILVGYEAGIIDENILNGTIILILITCVVASFATEQAAKKILVESNEEAVDLSTASMYQNEHILLPIKTFVNKGKVLDLVTLLKDKKSVNPISVLSIVSNDEEAERNIIKAHSNFEDLLKQASASDTKVDIITTIDHNAISGIGRISREIMADIIVLEWPQKEGFVEKLMGSKIETLLNTTDKTIFITQLLVPLSNHKRIVVVAPPLSEHESGFCLWFSKIALLAQELSVPVFVYGNEATQTALTNVVSKNKMNISLKQHLFTDWDEFLILSKEIHETDFLVFVSARKATSSYMGALEHVPAKLEKYFSINNKLIIYPHQYRETISGDQYTDFTGETLHKGIEAVQKLSKGIGSIFKSTDQD